jgi:hypothetical protein
MDVIISNDIKSNIVNIGCCEFWATEEASAEKNEEPKNIHDPKRAELFPICFEKVSRALLAAKGINAPMLSKQTKMGISTTHIFNTKRPKISARSEEENKIEVA